MNYGLIDQHDYMQVKRSERMSGDMQERLEDLHSLQETVRRNYTHMDPNNILSMKQVHVNIWSLIFFTANSVESQNMTASYFCR